MITNHLGNVLATITDRKLPDNVSAWPSWVAPAFFRAEVVTVSDYEPFGSALENRTWSRSAERYRYGFNGKENDDEVLTEGRFQDYGMRLYRPDLGRFVSVDPIGGKFAWLSSYQYAGNTPIQAVDLDGLEVVGYTALFQDARWGPVVRVVGMNQVFFESMREFVQVGVGDQIGASANGQFAGIRLRYSVNPNLDPMLDGATYASVLKTDGSTTALQEATTFSAGTDILEITIELAGGNPKTTVAGQAELNLTIPHEYALHAYPTALDMLSFRNGVITFDQLVSLQKERTKNSVLEETTRDGIGNLTQIAVQGHKELRDGSNSLHEAIMNDAVKNTTQRSYVGYEVGCTDVLNEPPPNSNKEREMMNAEVNVGDHKCKIARRTAAFGKIIQLVRATNKEQYNKPNAK